MIHKTHQYLQQWAERARSYFEGSPPIVVVNLDAFSILQHAEGYDSYWAGRALDLVHAARLSDAVLQLESHVSGRRAKVNVRQLGANLFQEPFKRNYRQVLYGGVAIAVLFDDSPADTRRFKQTKDHERGHAIQRMIGKGNIDSHAPIAELYARNEALKFRSNLRSNLYDPKDQACVVKELAMYIATGGWNDFGLSAEEATWWMTAYLTGIREMHGGTAVRTLRPVLRTSVAKAAYRTVMNEPGPEPPLSAPSSYFRLTVVSASPTLRCR